jgi:hypothetical protein
LEIGLVDCPKTLPVIVRSYEYLTKVAVQAAWVISRY